MTLLLRLLAPLVVALGALLAAPPARAIDIVEVTSPGGIKAWLVQDRTAPVISLSLAFLGGAALDPADKEGLAQFTAALLDEGAGDLDSEAFKSRLDEIAASLSFDAGLDRLGGSLRTLRDNRAEAFELLRLALTAPRFDEAAVARIRDQMLASLRLDEQRPGRIAGRALQEAVFGSHPYARPGDGTPQSVAAITTADIRAAAKRLLARDRLTLSVVGDISPEELAPLLDSTFGGLPAGGEQVPVPPWQPGRSKGRTIVIERPIPQSVVAMAQPGIQRDDPDWFAATIMNYVLGGGSFNSRLMEEVREKRGLAYGVSTGLWPYRQAGLIGGQVATANERVAESLKIIRAEWRRMAEQGITGQELADAKTYLTGSFALNFDSTSSIASVLQSIQFDELGIDYLDRRAGLIEKVTLEDVRRVAKRLLHEDQLVVVIVGQPVGVSSTP